MLHCFQIPLYWTPYRANAHNNIQVNNMDGILVILSEHSFLNHTTLQTAVDDYVKHKTGDNDFIKSGELFITSLRTFIKKTNDGSIPSRNILHISAVQYETVIEHRITDQT